MKLPTYLEGAHGFDVLVTTTYPYDERDHYTARLIDHDMTGALLSVYAYERTGKYDEDGEEICNRYDGHTELLPWQTIKRLKFIPQES